MSSAGAKRASRSGGSWWMWASKKHFGSLDGEGEYDGGRSRYWRIVWASEGASMRWQRDNDEASFVLCVFVSQTLSEHAAGKSTRGIRALRLRYGT